ncbi:MAG TPA: DUF1874 domain-containing protein [Candidatus Atribacteria bacterium]|nr:DUF1874 domain-containing protein [Candidatus Atribacteria bacterium]
MNYLANAFSLKMLEKDASRTTIDVFPVTIKEVKELLTTPFISIIGHEGTAQLFTELLGVYVEVNRVSYEMKNGDTLVVGLPSGGRLPEGKVLSKEELEALQLDWFIVKLVENKKEEWK